MREKRCKIINKQKRREGKGRKKEGKGGKNASRYRQRRGTME